MQNWTNTKLKDRLAWARERLGLTQLELAKRSKIAQSTIASWETGARETGRKITMLAEYLEVDPLWLVEGTGTPDIQRQPDIGVVATAPGLPERLRALVYLGQLNEREAALLHKFQMASELGKAHMETMASVAEKDALFVVHDQAKS